MVNFNKNITSLLNAKFKNLSFGIEDGRFLADKSYGFDTLFFMSRFIEHFRFGETFNKFNNKKDSLEYTKFLFTLGQDTAQTQNYLTETIGTLCFAGVMKTIKRSLYQITDESLLLFVSSSFENAYIFLYMLAYNIYKKYGWWPLYKRFCQTDNIDEKKQIVVKLRNEMVKHNPHIIDANASSNWAMFLTKYPLMILNYANSQPRIARTGNVIPETTSLENIALNTQGTRSNYGVSKRNNYLYTFSKDYVLATIRPYLAIDIPPIEHFDYSPSLAEDIADQRLRLFDERDHIVRKRKSLAPKYRQTPTGKIRTMQSEFRSELMRTVPHKCPICGFKFEDFLIASHIKPYAKCEDTYDAMNSNNGLLMCPVCDKLFESANYITIDAISGEVKYRNDIDHESDFQYIHNVVIDSQYIDCERRHYLKWHNDEFYRKHPL